MRNSTNLIRSIRFEEPYEGSGGGGADDFPKWMAQLSDEDKSNQDFAQFKTLPEFAASYKEHVRRAGKYEPAPDDPREYELVLPQTPPEGFEEEEPIKEAFRAFAKTNNFTKAQAKEAYSWFNKLIFDQFDTVQKTLNAQKEKSLAKLKTDWGDEFGAKSELAQRAMDRFGSPEFSDALKQSGFYTHPEIIKVFASIGEAIGEDQLEPGAGGDIDSREKFLTELYPTMVAEIPVGRRKEF